MPDVDKVNAVISMSETVQSRLHKGNAAALHRLFATKGLVNKLFADVSKKTPGKPQLDTVELQLALAENNICLSDKQIQTLSTAGKDNFFKTLLQIQQAEIKAYVDTQPQSPGGGPTGTTPKYYQAVSDLIAASTLLDAQDYVNKLSEHSTAADKPGQKKDEKPKGQLMTVMNREFALYAQVPNQEINYGSKAENVRYHYYKDVINALPKPDKRYEPWEKFIAANDKNFPGGFHIKVDTVYEKKGHIGHVKDQKPAGKGHHISIVNLGMSNAEAVRVINDRSVPCPMHDVKFQIGSKTYGIYLVDGKPLTFYKAELDDKGNFKLDVKGQIMRSELKASESSNLTDGGTKLLSPKGSFDSVTHAIAHSIKQMKERSMGLEASPAATPILTSDDKNSNKSSFTVKSGTNPPPTNEPPLKIGAGSGPQITPDTGAVPALSISAGDASVPVPQASIDSKAVKPVAQAVIMSKNDRTQDELKQKVKESSKQDESKPDDTLRILVSPKNN